MDGQRPADQIGQGYARTRREDPRFRALLHAALGGARTVVNVGAGTSRATTWWPSSPAT